MSHPIPGHDYSENEGDDRIPDLKAISEAQGEGHIKRNIAKKMTHSQKKWERKIKADKGKSFGKSFWYEYGRKKAKTIAQGKKAGEQFKKKHNL